VGGGGWGGWGSPPALRPPPSPAIGAADPPAARGQPKPADEDAELEKRLAKLRLAKGATPYGEGSKAEERKVPARAAAGGEEAKPAKIEYDYTGETVFYEGPPHRGDLALNLALGASLIWLPLTFAAIGRAAFVNYRCAAPRAGGRAGACAPRAAGEGGGADGRLSRSGGLCAAGLRARPLMALRAAPRRPAAAPAAGSRTAGCRWRRRRRGRRSRRTWPIRRCGT